MAQLFTNTANIELNEHFAMLATLAGLVATDTNANLHDAINGEQHEADVMYPDYARQADQPETLRPPTCSGKSPATRKPISRDFRRR